jgi:50S ribosomal protein L16 3-hydroxylase
LLEEWLNPMKVSAFARDYLRTQPYASPASASRAMAIFGWDTLDLLLTRNPPDVLVVARGKLLELPAPRNLSEALDLLTRGVGLVVRRAEKLDPGVAGLAASVTQHIPGEVHVQLIVTPAGSYGFGWHYDDEDVFIVQTQGAKDYFFRDNTVERERPPVTAPDFSRFGNEVSPLGTARLLAGDWLYIPARWWHAAKCIEDSLSISLGIFPEPFWLSSIDK